MRRILNFRKAKSHHQLEFEDVPLPNLGVNNMDLRIRQVSGTDQVRDVES